MDCKKLLTVLVISITIISLYPGSVQSKSGVIVGNISPKIQEAYLKKDEGSFNLTIIATDYNGWHNIHFINCSILDSEDNPIATYGYKQYKGNNFTKESRVDRFYNLKNDCLDTEESIVERHDNKSSLEGKTELILEFHFDTKGGNVIQLEIVDTLGLSSKMEIELPSIMKGVYNILPIVIIAAVAITTYISYRKFKNISMMEVK